MSATPPLSSGTTTGQGRLGFANDVVRHFDRRSLASQAVLLVGLLALASYAMVPMAWSASAPARLARLFTTAFTTVLMIVAVVIADEAVDRGARRLPAYVLAVIGAALVGSLAGHELCELIGLRLGKVPDTNSAYAFSRRADIVLIGILVGGLATFVHVHRRTALAARRRQHKAERERAAAQKRTLESQLQALQARVEPVFLFATLERIRLLYRDDAVAGRDVLERLIAYLRAALPRLRDSFSTVEQELALARAWLEIMDTTVPGLVTTCEVDVQARTARLPAMVLLPLVQLAIEQPVDAPMRGVATAEVADDRLWLRLQAAQGRLSLEVDTSGDAFASGMDGRVPLRRIEERLHALYGSEVDFEARPSAHGGSAVRVELPFEPALDAMPAEAAP